MLRPTFWKFAAVLIFVLPALACGGTPDAATPTREPMPTWTPTTAPVATAAPAMDPPMATPLPAPTDTPLPPTAAPAIIAAPVANDVANLREGPGTDYGIAGSAAPGETLAVVGQTGDGTWLQLATGLWIAAALVDGAPAGLPVVGMGERTAPNIEVAPTVAAGPVCGCGEDLYKCADFPSRAAAQACFDYCSAQGAGDIHRLDQDNNLRVCEDMQ